MRVARGVRGPVVLAGHSQGSAVWPARHRIHVPPVLRYPPAAAAAVAAAAAAAAARAGSGRWQRGGRERAAVARGRMWWGRRHRCGGAGEQGGDAVQHDGAVTRAGEEARARARAEDGAGRGEEGGPPGDGPDGGAVRSQHLRAGAPTLRWGDRDAEAPAARASSHARKEEQLQSHARACACCGACTVRIFAIRCARAGCTSTGGAMVCVHSRMPSLCGTGRCLQDASRFAVPHAHGAVAAAGCQDRAAGAPCDGVDVVGMTAQVARRRKRDACYVVKAHSAVTACGGKERKRGMPSDGRHCSGMGAGDEQLSSRRQGPDAD